MYDVLKAMQTTHTTPINKRIVSNIFWWCVVFVPSSKPYLQLGRQTVYTPAKIIRQCVFKKQHNNPVSLCEPSSINSKRCANHQVIQVGKFASVKNSLACRTRGVCLIYSQPNELFIVLVLVFVYTIWEDMLKTENGTHKDRKTRWQWGRHL